MQRFAIYLIILLFVSITTGQPPSIPLTVTGTVRINGEFAPVGTMVTAEMDGETEDYELTEPGVYVLSVPGTSGDYGKEVNFYVDEIPMNQTAEWRSGGLVNLDFVILIPSEEKSTTTSSSSTSLTSTSTITVEETTSTTLESSTSTTAKPETTVIETTLPSEEGNVNESHLPIKAAVAVILIISLGVLALILRRT